MLNLSMSALQNFGGPALIKLYNIPLAFATGALTAYLVGVAVGVLGGGYIADMTKHHGKVASIGFAFTALITLALAVASLGPYAIIAAFAAAGLCSGLIMPSRDMMVREAATPGAVGRTFGFVTFGFNFGGTIGPIMYGYLLDRNLPREMLLLAFCFMLAAIAMPLAGEWLRARRQPQTAVAA
jgi:MFS family permease